MQPHLLFNAAAHGTYWQSHVLASALGEQLAHPFTRAVYYPCNVLFVVGTILVSGLYSQLNVYSKFPP